MQKPVLRLRNAVFGAMVAGSLAFGATQATASAPSGPRCDYPNVPSACVNGAPCGHLCASGEGECANNCCYCLI